jgi:DNA (cytosine-5)-methyltransferase 1
MLYALDLFSGIGGNSLGLKQYARTIAYCERDKHAQAVLLSRMSDGMLPRAPICSDITLLDGRDFRGKIDIIVAGFPCQDLSYAGKGKGLAGERSGLFFEIVRLAKEIKPAFLFLENVPGIRTRGLDTVIQELTSAGYDCRWTMLSAAEVGANHKRERWFLLGRKIPDANSVRHKTEPRYTKAKAAEYDCPSGIRPNLAYTKSERCERSLRQSGVFTESNRQTCSERSEQTSSSFGCSDADCVPTTWTTEPDMGRVAHGVPQRVDRIKRLGNAVVPAQAKAAFEILMGIGGVNG